MADEIDNSILRQVGSVLYGSRWKSPLAADLNVTDKKLQSWDENKEEVPVEVRNTLKRILKTHRDAMDAILRRL